jgi:hypothetical protein
MFIVFLLLLESLLLSDIGAVKTDELLITPPPWGFVVVVPNQPVNLDERRNMLY